MNSRSLASSSPAKSPRMYSIAPANSARSTSRDGRSASALISSVVRDFPSTTPPLMIRALLVLPKSRSAFATAAASPAEPSGFSPTKARAVGPTRSSSSSSPSSAAASFTSVFL